MSDPHAGTAELGYLSVNELAARLETRELTSLELVEQLLERVAAIDRPGTETALHSLAAVASDALAQAARCDDERERGQSTGVLHGIPIVIKDNIEANGLPALAGSSSLTNRPVLDAPLVTRLRRAGAVVMASTNLSQWANIRSPRSTSGWSATGGLVANPWALDRSAGGSSSGSGAAVAAGLAPLAVGTETDGSIICPASLNGVVGLKPTVGVVPTRRVIPVSASQDSPGPMGRSVDDVARLFGVLADDRPARRSHEPLRFAFAANWTVGHEATDRLVAQFVTRLVDQVGAVESRDVAAPSPRDYQDEMTVLMCELFDDLSAYLNQREGDGVKSLADVVAYENAHRELEMPFFGHEHFDLALGSGGRRSAAYGESRARNLEWAMNSCLGPGLNGVDVLVSAAYGPAWKSDLVVGGHLDIASCATTAPAIAGWPILSVPIGLVHGLPIGLAIIARPHDEWRLLEAGRVVESVALEQPLPRPGWRVPSRR